MLLLLLLLLLLPQNNDSENDSCGKVEFSSKNFKNILTWTTKEGVRYDVLYKEYDNSPWRVKAECTNITQNWCDLTNETSNYSDQYYGKVVINDQDCNRTDRFNPLLDTILDPPIVNLILTGTSLTIHLTHVVEHLSSMYEGLLQYEINVSGKPYKTTDPFYTIENIDLQTTHCVSARLVLVVKPKSIFSNKTCIETKTDQTPEKRGNIILYILGIVLVIFTVFGVGYGVHKYIHVDNLQQPQILNLTSNNNNNLVLVDSHNITINVITIESGKSNEQSTTMDEKDEEKYVKKDLYSKDDGYDVSHGSGVPEDDYDMGYISLLEQVPAPHVSPYDMPHHFLETPAKPSMTPSVIRNKEEGLYGRIKCNDTIASIQENNTVEAYQKAGTSEEMSTYLPKNDQHIPRLDLLSHDPDEDSSVAREADKTDVTDATDFRDCETLFIDWSPTSHQLYIPNLCNKAVEVGTEECQEGEGLLSHLYKPIQIEETPEELACLEQRWGLHVKMHE